MNKKSWFASMRAALFAYSRCQRPTLRSRSRLSLEQLDERITPSTTSFTAMEVPGQGVWEYSSTGGWQHPTTLNASALAVNATGKMAMEIQGQGVWVYDYNSHGWQ